MPTERLVRYLEENQADYETLEHPSAVTAQEIAAAAHVSGEELAKTVIVELEDDLAMAVLPASCSIDLDRLASVAGAEHAELASEDRFRDLFPDAELGAMAPFGNLYELDVFVADRLAEDDRIAFNAGTHTELIRMRYEDFERLVEPVVGSFAVHA